MESFIVLTVVTECDAQFECWMEDDSRSGEKSLHELEFNDLNIHLYLTLNNEMASEHVDFDFVAL